MKIGFVGLGRMGTRMVEKLLADGHEVIGWNRTYEITEEFGAVLKDKKFRGVKTLKDLADALQPQKIIWMMLPAGEPTDFAIKELTPYLKKNDILIDGGNAHFKDTELRYQKFKTQNLKFLGIGVSGGIKAGDKGYPLMIGGDKSAFEKIKPILETLVKPHGGYQYFGEGGAGHFVKMVHNGIEYGMMQAIGEGFGVLEKAPYKVDLRKVGALWQKNTIVTSFLMQCVNDALVKDQYLSKIDGLIDATGEALWTVEQGKVEKVPVENIEQSLDFRRRSKTDKKVSSSFAARMVAALRHEFGGHSVKKK